MPRGYELHLYDGKGYSRNRDWKEGTYYVTKGYSILQDNLPTREAALRWAQEHAKGRGKSGKQRFVSPQLEHITRTGPDRKSSGSTTLIPLDSAAASLVTGSIRMTGKRP